jgi:hypothetical protein
MARLLICAAGCRAIRAFVALFVVGLGCTAKLTDYVWCEFP